MCARESHRLFLEMLQRSAFIEAISIFISVLAEVWSICIEMCKAAVQFYNEFRRHFVKSYEQLKKLPKHLDRWLGDEYTEYIDVNVDQNRLRSNEDFILFDGTDKDNQGMIIEEKFEPKLLVSERVKAGPKNRTNEGSASNIFQSKGKSFKTQDLMIKREFKNESPPAKPSISMKSIPLSIKMETLDLGAKISRDNAKVPMKKIVKHINVEQLKTVKEIRQFLDVEDELRDEKLHKNSAGIGEEDWDKFKKSTNQILILGHPGLAMKKFRTLWQKLNKSRKR